MTDRDSNYAGVYDRRVGFGQRPALLMIDFAHAYYDPDCPLYGGEGCRSALAAALELRRAARAADIPVILTRVSYHPSGRDGGRFFEKAAPLEAFLPGRATAEFAEGLLPHADEIVVTKQYPSAFFGTSLAPMLTSMGCDSVLLSGLTTSGCVRASCVDAMSHGFRTLVVADACGDRHSAPHEANLFDMNAKYADVVSLPDTLTHLAGRKAA
ncbi:isochorismatase family protein [Paracoccus sp. 1_MG-2023]|uniref:isochorismatase family protein n=1 Tax=unclassified Paracoccus (in: a-proteobacteria) TaxID=2688777 RepID=UPI001C0A5219|nr:MULTISPECIES: isochorismatase family protein [unclassified Paracoccus (in: a-proteobacteria)]MBU2957644.1 isochorismatase family protein [Paracoccus sp. C2R09]MDO6667509.1 isochorismatase family protein [Paracoccus sp. 1_MG-2023]